jgi:hypothetical protein
MGLFETAMLGEAALFPVLFMGQLGGGVKSWLNNKKNRRLLQWTLQEASERGLTSPDDIADFVAKRTNNAIPKSAAKKAAEGAIETQRLAGMPDDPDDLAANILKKRKGSTAGTTKAAGEMADDFVGPPKPAEMRDDFVGPPKPKGRTGSSAGKSAAGGAGRAAGSAADDVANPKALKGLKGFIKAHPAMAGIGAALIGYLLSRKIFGEANEFQQMDVQGELAQQQLQGQQELAPSAEDIVAQSKLGQPSYSQLGMMALDPRRLEMANRAQQQAQMQQMMQQLQMQQLMGRLSGSEMPVGSF